MCLLLENVGGSEQNRSVANVQSDDLWPSRIHAATHILQEKAHACGVLKRHNFRVHVSLGSAQTLVRRGGIINHRSIAYSLSNISAKNYRNRLMWVESIVCNISVVFLGHKCIKNAFANHLKQLLRKMFQDTALTRSKSALPSMSDLTTDFDLKLEVFILVPKCTNADSSVKIYPTLFKILRQQRLGWMDGRTDWWTGRTNSPNT